MTRDEVLKYIEKAKERGEVVNLSGADLSGADLSYMDLSGINLTGANLRFTNLSGTVMLNVTLCLAKLDYADLSGVVLRYADLRGATLYKADLKGADLKGADLSGVNLRGANLKCVYLEDADLYGADLDFSCLPLWCGSLQMHIDEAQAKQLLYHVLSLVSYSKHIRKRTKKLLLTEELVEYANKFHRVGELSRLREIEREV